MQHSNTDSCILLKFYIKPQQNVEREIAYICCILLKFYIKPQLRSRRFYCYCVVSY